MALKFTNNASATLASSLTNTGTSISLTSGQGALFPALSAGDFFYATLVDSSNNLEVIKVTARSSDTLTVTRGQDGTSARAYAAGDRLELRVIAAGFDEFIQRDGSVAFTGQVTVQQGTAAGKAINASRTISTSGGIQGGGDLTADRTLSLTDTGVSAGSAGSSSSIPVITVDAKGRITALSSAAVAQQDLAWTNITGRPTALSQFTNNLGNYGSWVAANTKTRGGDAYRGISTGNCGNMTNAYVDYFVLDTGSAFDAYKVYYNCHNCDCQCC